jgi:dCTP deaminase
MFLSDRDLRWAIVQGHLIVTQPDGKPNLIGPTSIDLRLDSADQAKVWDIPKFKSHNKTHGHGDVPELRVGTFDYKAFAGEFQKSPKLIHPGETTDELVFRRGDEIIVRPRGFVLWQTKERVGTPEEGARYICFVDGKSTKARTGIVVHMTAPTIHAAWGAWNVTLEIGNLGPFDAVLKEDDVIAQITVAMISSVPEQTMKAAGSATAGQTNVGLQPPPA